MKPVFYPENCLSKTRVPLVASENREPVTKRSNLVKTLVGSACGDDKKGSKNVSQIIEDVVVAVKLSVRCRVGSVAGPGKLCE